MQLSVIINTKNSAKTLKTTLNSVKFADEIVIVDMNSSDDTQKIAKEYTQQIFSFRDMGYVEPARNFAIQKAKYPWILIVDSDEIINKSLRKKILEIIKDSEQPDAFEFPRKNIIFDKWIQKTGWWPDYQLRLFKKDQVKWSDKIHSQPQVKGSVVRLDAIEDLAIEHHNYQSIDQFVDRLNRYTNIEAQENQKQNYKFSPEEALKIFFDQFIDRIFVHQGLADGMHGVSLSLLQASYQLIAYLKVWQKYKFPYQKSSQKLLIKAIQKIIKEIKYWVADWKIKNTTGFIQLYWRLRRRFKI